jgi:hypothetical protein
MPLAVISTTVSHGRNEKFAYGLSKRQLGMNTGGRS